MVMMLVSFFDQLSITKLDLLSIAARSVLTPLVLSVELPCPQNLELLIWSSMMNCTIVSLTCKSFSLAFD